MTVKMPVPRPLPRLIVLSLPEMKRKLKRIPSTRSGIAERSLEDNIENSDPNPQIFAARNAIDEILALINFLRPFLTGVDPCLVETIKWFKSMEYALDGVDSDIENGCFDTQVTIDALSSMEEALAGKPDMDEHVDNVIEVFPWNMLNYWLKEIDRRGWELIHILIYCVNIRDAEKFARTMKSMRYPIR
jgi:hypothetical protein